MSGAFKHGKMCNQLEGIQSRCAQRISGCFQHRNNTTKMWNLFVEALYEDCLLSVAEKNNYLVSDNKTIPDFGSKPRSEEAIRRILYYLWSLESIIAHHEGGEHTPWRRLHRVRTMPTWSCVIPAYEETILFDEKQLTRTRAEKATQQRITEIEYLVHTFPEEWDHFAERMKIEQGAYWVVNSDNFPMDLLHAFLKLPGHRELDEKLRFEICWWATMRGQIWPEPLRA